MNNIRPGLGRGLDALINPKLKDKIDTPIAISTSEIQKDDGSSYDILAKIDINQISPNPYQPRTEFDPLALDELKKSILENGLIQPITVRRLSKDNYQLISGERRLRACREIGTKEMPAYIIKVDTKEGMLALALIENIQREQLNSIEVAHAYKRLLDECNLSQEEVAEKVGKDRSTITNFLRLLKLPIKIQNSLAKDEITNGHARALIGLPTELIQLDFLDKILKENLSVRKVEELVRNYLAPKKSKKAHIAVPKGYDSISIKSLEEKLQRILGTKVNYKQNKNGSGELIIEFYSPDEFERLYEMIEGIGKHYN